MKIEPITRSHSHPGTPGTIASDVEFTLQRDALKLTVCKRSGKITHLEAFGSPPNPSHKTTGPGLFTPAR